MHTQAILLHGTGGSPESFWLPWLAEQLQTQTTAVHRPSLPGAELPELSRILPFLQSNFSLDEGTLLVGHSSACPAILSWLQEAKQPVAQVVLVAGFYAPIDDDGISQKMLPKLFIRIFCLSFAKTTFLLTLTMTLGVVQTQRHEALPNPSAQA